VAQQKIVITQNFNERVASVYERLSDHNKLGEVFGVPVKRIKDGRNAPNGVGSVRRIAGGPLAVEETVTAAEPNRSIDYRITKGGAPIRNHSGRIEFSEASDGSRVRWTIEFDAPPVAGPALRVILEKGISRGLKRMA